jgi:hypothetical protein
MAISAASLGLFSSSSSTTSSTISSIDLSSIYSASTYDTSTTTTKKNITKLPPWDSSAPKTATDKLANTALSNPSLFSGGLASGTAGSAVKDLNDQKLFMVHNALNKLKALAEIASSKTLTDAERTKFQTRIDKGLTEIKSYVAANPLSGASLIAGKKFGTLLSDSLGVSTTGHNYTTGVLATGDSETVPMQFEGNVKFSIDVKDQIGGVKSIAIDLSQMGTTKRTIGNVSNFINNKLEAAGILSRFSRVETTKAATVKGMSATTEQRLKVTFDDTEVLSFRADSSDTENAIYVAGGKTVDDLNQGIISRIDLNGASTEAIFRTDLTAAKGSANIRAMTHDKEGNVYVIANSTGEISGLNAKQDQDVVLQKLDSTGKVVFTRALGSAADSQGFSIAVDIDGTIAIAGAVNGKIDKSANITGEKLDSFVAAFDAEGRDLWTHQQGALGDDQALDIKFDDSGNLLVLGKTTNSIGGATMLGGTDTYVQALDDTGKAIYTKTIGTSGNDTPVSLAINGTNAYVAWNDGSGLGHISRLNTNDGSIAAADKLASSYGLSKIGKFTLDDSGNMLIAGAKTGGQMIDQLKNINVTNDATIFAKDFAGEVINSINVDNGRIDLAFDGVFDEAAADTETNQTKLVGISQTNGNQIYNVNVQAEAKSNVFITSTQGNSKSLQALGLPQGEVVFGETQSLTDVTGLHAGDYFYIAANNGAKRKISIAQGETMVTLAKKVNTYLTRFANVTTLSKNGGKYLSITPKGTNKVEIIAGEGSQDALKQLGLDPGFAQAASAVTTNAKTGTKSNVVIAMEIPETIDVSDKTKAKTTMDSLDSVMRRVRMGYRDISTDETQVALRKASAAGAQKKGSTSSNSAAAVSAYNAQTANMQAALSRLTA